MSSASFDPEALIDAMAPLLGLDADPGVARRDGRALEDRGASRRRSFFRSALDDRGGARAGVHAVTAKLLDGSAQAIAAAVRSGAVSAREIAQETLSRIKARNSALGAFTDVTATRALAKADAIDAARARGESLGPLAGAPFAVKNLFDIEGLPTRAGSKINRDRAPAKADATAIARLEAAGGVLVGALNMGEFAYDFTGQNVA